MEEHHDRVSPSDSSCSPAAPSSAKCLLEKGTTSWPEYRRTGQTTVGNLAEDLICESPRVIGKECLTDYRAWSSSRETGIKNQHQCNEISPSGLYEQCKLPQPLSQMTLRCPYRLIWSAAAARTRRKSGALLETSQSKTNQRLGCHCQNLLSWVRNPGHAAASLAPHLPTSAEFTNEPIRGHHFLFYLPGQKMLTKGGCKWMNIPILLLAFYWHVIVFKNSTWILK